MNMKGSKKGANMLIPAMFLLLIMAMVWSVINVPFIKDTNVIEKDVEVRSEIHIMGNALDAAKLYMETALAYSTYQACYDSLRNGGWNSLQGKKVYQGYALWDSSEQHLTMLEFKGNFESSIKENLGLYGGTKAYTFLSDYHVNLPSYTAVSADVDENTEKLSVTAIAESNLNIQKTQESGEYIRLEKESALYGSYDLDCYGIYAKGAEIYGKAGAAVSDILKQANLPAKVANLDDAKKPISDAEDKIKAAMYSLSATGSDYDVGVDVLGAKINYVTLGVDSSGTSLSYVPEVYVKFEITNIKDGQQFPIYDGSSVAMSPLTLTFVGKYGASQ